MLSKRNNEYNKICVYLTLKCFQFELGLVTVKLRIPNEENYST